MPDFSVVWRNLDYFLWGRLAEGQIGGLLATVLMSFAAGILALVGGSILALVAWNRPGAVRRVLFFWADLIRGIPLIFVIFWLFFLLPALLRREVPSPVSVVLALAWFSSAAVMYSLYSGLAALPKGQSEAGRASGLSEWSILTLILLPQALRNLIPSMVALFVSLIKDTSLAVIVNVPELTTAATQINNATFLYPAEIFLFTGLLYYLLCTGLSRTSAWIEASVDRRRRVRI